MAICTGKAYTESIDRTECIGNSLTKINSNFSSLDNVLCGLASEQNLLGDITSVKNVTVYNNIVPALKGGAGSVNGIMKANGLGTVTAARASIDYLIPSDLSTALARYTDTASLGSTLAAYAFKTDLIPYALTTTLNGLSSYADYKFATNDRVDALSSYADYKFATNVKVEALSSYADYKFATNVKVTALSSYVDYKFIANPAGSTNGQVLAWNASTSIWYPANISGAGGIVDFSPYATNVKVDALSSYVDYKFATNTRVDDLSSYVDLRFALTDLKTNNLSSYADYKFATDARVTALTSYADYKFATDARVTALTSYADYKFATDARVTGLSAYADYEFARKDSLAIYENNNVSVNLRIDGLSAYADYKFATNDRVTALSAYADAKFIIKPASASSGNVLTYNNGTWVAGVAPSYLPSLGTGDGGKVLTFSSSTLSWVASAALPVGTAGQILTYDGATNSWVAKAAPITLPSGSAQQVLTYNGSTNTWVASAITMGVPPVITTSTGNGIQTAFTVNGYTNNSVNSYLVVVGGLTQRPGNDYSVTTNTINFAVAPPVNAAVLILAWQTAPTAAGAYVAVGAAVNGMVYTDLVGDGTKQSFAISGYTTAALDRYQVFVGGLYQRPGVSYNISAGNVVFTAPPANGVYVSIVAFRFV